MKRSEIRVGQKVALATSPDWAESPYRVTEATVADTRAFTARRGGYRNLHPQPLELEDGTEIPGAYYALSEGKATCLVRVGQQAELRLVQLAHLRGDYDACLATATTRDRARRESAARLEAARKDSAARVVAAAAALAEKGVDVGYVGGYENELKLRPKALEQILALLEGQK